MQFQKPKRALGASSRVIAVLFLLLASGPFIVARSQVSGPDRERGHVMLKQVRDDIKGNFYEPTFRGLDLDARFKAADQMLDKATSLGQIFGIIAQTVIGLNDSHTFFVPPEQTVHSDYGWQLQAIGDRCYVVAVKPGSDAATKGLKPGDEVLAVNGIAPVRKELWKFRYLYYQLRPQAGMHLVVQSPGGEPRPLDILAKVKNDKRRLDFTQGWDIFQTIREIENESQLYRHRYAEIGDEVFIWKMPVFGDPDKIDSMMDRVGRHKALILDLRGNSGGAEETLLRLVGRVFDKEVAVGTLKRRKESKELVSKTRGKNAYQGKVVVLVDSDSASAAELFARLVQIEKRGVVIGDRTAGAVMRGKFVPHQMGMDVAVFYGMSVTDADLVMTDGKSLENTGVVPDERMVPTAKALADKLDPVLSYAAELVGANLDPAKAGAMFPREWVKQD
jgi:C-terminal processing protease CtpA/Prc